MSQKIPFRQANYVTSAVKTSQFPSICDPSGEEFPEIAAAGRSNVGKSTLINNLLRQNKLAKTSQTPGKTQMLNFFSVDEQLVFTDLPGYGFAKVPNSVRAKWGKMVDDYIQHRKNLKAVLFLLDVRRIPNDDDWKLVTWLEYHNIPIILVLTKVDKLPKTKRQSQVNKVLKAFEGRDIPVVSYSSTKNIGRDKLIQLINTVVSHGSTE